jgi:hypothetical protein
MNGMMNELSEDMAKGQGEALTTYAVVLGVAPEDRAHFAAVTHEHFQQIFSKADVTAEDVHTNTLAVLKTTPPGQVRHSGLSSTPPRFFREAGFVFGPAPLGSLFFFELVALMLKRLAWLALIICAPLSAAPQVDPQRLQQLANDPSGFPWVITKPPSSAAGAATSVTKNSSSPPMAMNT